MALGDINVTFAWQAWLLLTLSFFFCVAGVALIALGITGLGLVTGLVAFEDAALRRGKCGT